MSWRDLPEEGNYRAGCSKWSGNISEDTIRQRDANYLGFAADHLRTQLFSRPHYFFVDALPVKQTRVNIDLV